MSKRYVVIWFRHLTTDWMARRRPELRDTAFVLASPERGRMIVKAASATATAKGICPGMVVADCRAIMPDLKVFDYKAGLAEKILHALGEWCIRFTPFTSVDNADGLILDASGCTHLWGGEPAYLRDIITRLKDFGYSIRAAIADTIGAAWAIAHFGQVKAIIEPGGQIEALLSLPPAALRLNTAIIERLEKLGLYQLRNIIHMPRRALNRRFGPELLKRIDQAIGLEHEAITPVYTAAPYEERLPCLEPIRTATGIEIGLKQLIETLCVRLEKESKGLRNCLFRCYRIDGNIQQISIATSRASRNADHIFKLFENKIALIEPDLGIELFILEAPVTEDLTSQQEALWNISENGNSKIIAELLDRIADKAGANTIHRYLPAEHHWPERSIRLAGSIDEKPDTEWRTDLPRPVHLLSRPEPIEVTVPIPDYPPMLFRYKGELHKVIKADGPERIEQEWWIEKEIARDYYCVEDEDGRRYWLYRSGQYDKGDPKWFVHGFFA